MILLKTSLNLLIALSKNLENLYANTGHFEHIIAYNDEVYIYDESEIVTPKETTVLEMLLNEGTITAEQAQQALDIQQRNKTSLLEILGAMNFIDVRDYAADLAEVTETGYVSDLIDSENFAYDLAFIRQFDPALMIHRLFVPVQQTGDLVIVLAVDPDEDAITNIVQRTCPDADVISLIGTTYDIKKLVNMAFAEQFTEEAVHGLERRAPQHSASTVFTRPQLAVLALLLVALLGGLAFAFWPTVRFLIVLFSVLYIIGIGFKFALSLAGMLNREHRARQHDIEQIDDASLPIYSILVPVYKEPEVVPRLLKALSRIDYPREKLDVLLLMEDDDSETIASAKAAKPPSLFRFIRVPESLPRTKPKACNYGLPFCRGEYVTIYDAEDIPEPDQLKKAVAAFRSDGDDLICIQARLNYFNSHENYLTGMFTLEYTYWFDYLLPGLDRYDLPIPLGGTSNHFRLDKLLELGAWDPYNVTEDADLGIRASARGYRVGVINSTTYEEANKKLGNWLRQRSRWIKGYMQTWLVHNRNPLGLLRKLGLKDWLSYQFFIGGTVWVFLINPIMWSLFLIWLFFDPAWLSQLFYGWVWEIAMFSLVVGNLSVIVLNLLASVRRSRDRLLLYSFTNPLYWVLHSIAAYIALYQLIRKPFYWEKTTHGLTTVDPEHLFNAE